MLDADERTTPELLTAMREHCTSNSPAAVYRIHRRDHFMGTWIRHVTPSPFNIRLVRPDAIHFGTHHQPITVVHGDTVELSALQTTSRSAGA